ncbi:hypothetical protein H4S04_005616, partial [Coemansia sp. S16]
MKFVSSFLFLAAIASATPGLVNVDRNDNVLNFGNNRPGYVNNDGYRGRYDGNHGGNDGY